MMSGNMLINSSHIPNWQFDNVFEITGNYGLNIHNMRKIAFNTTIVWTIFENS